MGQIGKTALHSVLAITVLFVLVRLMGKKLISQLTFFDYVSGIIIGSVAADFAIDTHVGYLEGFTAVLIFTAFPISLSLISLKSRRGRTLLDGKPEILIYQGKMIHENMRRTKMNVNDLLEECRQNDVFNIDEIESAILETNGKLSVQLKALYQPVTTRDMNLFAAENGLCTNLVVDGNILYDHLRQLKRDESWLMNELRGLNAPDIQGVLLAYADVSGKVYVQMKGVQPPASPIA